jgi:hypothetical protein
MTAYGAELPLLPGINERLKIALKGTAAQCRFSVDVFVSHPGLSERPSSRL